MSTRQYGLVFQENTVGVFFLREGAYVCLCVLRHVYVWYMCMWYMCVLVHEEVRDQPKLSFIRNHPHFLELYYYIYACMMYARACTCHDAQIEVRGQLTVVDFLLPPCGSWRPDSGL